MPKLRTVLAALGVATGVYLVLRPRRLSFADSVVVITGGSRGLGLVLARQLAKKGARLALLARSSDELDEARRQVEELGGEAHTIACNVADRDELVAALNLILEHFGQINVLINNAGAIQVGPLEHMRVEDFQASLDVHFWAPLHAIWTVLPHMRERGHGRIVNISSIGGKVAVPHLLPYCAGKHALAGLSEGLGHELRNHGIFVTTVYPGLMRTGSPPNVDVRGQRDKEYTWFAVGDSLPLLAIDAERAAQKILDACRRGQPRLTITLQARMLAMLNEIVPGAFARVSGVVNRLLPAPTGPEGDAGEPGREHETAVTRSFLTVLGRKAAARNNESAPPSQPEGSFESRTSVEV
jgi:NAD(P)-dependent dehydrogenase (short-subunit alcohol dehydrogenase family)